MEGARDEVGNCWRPLSQSLAIGLSIKSLSGNVVYKKGKDNHKKNY